MKNMFIGGVSIFVAGLLLGIAQLWLSIWNQETFAKMELTLGGLAAILLVVWFVRKEYEQDKKTRSGQGLD